MRGEARPLGRTPDYAWPRDRSAMGSPGACATNLLEGGGATVHVIHLVGWGRHVYEDALTLLQICSHELLCTAVLARAVPWATPAAAPPPPHGRHIHQRTARGAHCCERLRSVQRVSHGFVGCTIAAAVPYASQPAERRHALMPVPTTRAHIHILIRGPAWPKAPNELGDG